MNSWLLIVFFMSAAVIGDDAKSPSGEVGGNGEDLSSWITSIGYEVLDAMDRHPVEGITSEEFRTALEATKPIFVSQKNREELEKNFGVKILVNTFHGPIGPKVQVVKHSNEKGTVKFYMLVDYDQFEGLFKRGKKDYRSVSHGYVMAAGKVEGAYGVTATRSFSTLLEALESNTNNGATAQSQPEVGMTTKVGRGPQWHRYVHSASFPSFANEEDLEIGPDILKIGIDWKFRIEKKSNHDEFFRKEIGGVLSFTADGPAACGGEDFETYCRRRYSPDVTLKVGNDEIKAYFQRTLTVLDRMSVKLPMWFNWFPETTYQGRKFRGLTWISPADPRLTVARAALRFPRPKFTALLKIPNFTPTMEAMR